MNAETVFADLDQNTPAWHDWRRFKLSASDAPIVMNAAPTYWEARTWADLRARLHAEAAGEPVDAPRLFQERLFSAGHQAEANALAWFSERLGTVLAPRCASRDLGAGLHLAASFDGIHTPARVHAEVKSATSPKSKINALIGDPAALEDDTFAYIRWQLVHQAGVLGNAASGYAFNVVVAGVSPSGKRVHGTLPVDPAHFPLDALLERWTRFLAGDDQERLDPHWRAAAADWLAADDALKAAQKRIAAAKKTLLALVEADDDPLHLQQGCGVRVTTYERTDVRWRDVANQVGTSLAELGLDAGQLDLGPDDLRTRAGRTSTVTTVKRSETTAR